MIQINAPREHTFSEPLGLLSDCHRRIEKFLDQLLRVTQSERGGELSPNACATLETALRYFRQAAPLHTSDEEDSLFPRLRELAVGENATATKARAVLNTVARLESDHAAADVRHAVIDELGALWLERSTLSEAEAAQLETELSELRAFYASHIAVEDNELFPLAAGVLDAAQIETIGREMASRRGVEFNSPDFMNRCASRQKATPKN